MIDVERSQPPPESLAKGNGWRGEDVKSRLRQDFLRKCYLCEGPLGRNFDVEHRHPRSAGGEEYDWNNLFPAHHDCNIGRPAYPAGGLLSPGDGVERRLRQWLDDEHLPRFRAQEDEDVEAANTATELDHIHHSSTDAASDLRHAIRGQLARVLERANRLLLLRSTRRGDTAEAHDLEHELRYQLSRRAPYSVLIRNRLDPEVLHSLR